MASPLNRRHVHVPSWFVERALGPDAQVARRAAFLAVDRNAHAGVAGEILAGREYLYVGDSATNTACVYEVDLQQGVGLSLYLFTLLPSAAVIVSEAGKGLIEFVAASSQPYGGVVKSVQAAGFCALSESDCRQRTNVGEPPIRERLTVWECLFEMDLEPPWERSKIQ